MTNPPYPDQPSYPPGPDRPGHYGGPGGPGAPGGPAGPGDQGGVPGPRRPPYGPPPQRPPADDLGRVPGASYGQSLGGPQASRDEQRRDADVPAGAYSSKSFLGALFDLSFDHMVTIRLIRLSYLLVLIFTGISAFGMLLLAWSFSEWNGLFALVTVLAIPVVSLGQLVLTRMFLEFLINQFKITEELRKLRETGGMR